MINERNKSGMNIPYPPSLGQKGSALIITLLMITILVTLVVQFTYEVFIDSSSVSNWGNAQQASMYAKSGQVLSSEYINKLNQTSYSFTQKSELPVNKDLGPDSTLNITIEDESARFNINSIIFPNGLTNDKALSSLKKLLESLNINPNLALFIADWIDPDSEPRIFGSETTAKNRFFWSVEEIYLVDNLKKNNTESLIDFLTVFGDGGINVNTARLPVLVSMDENMTDSLAKRVIDYRETSPFEDPAHVQRVSGMETIGANIIDKITVKTSTFRVVSKATVNEVTRVIESVMDSSMKILFWREN